MLQFSRNSNLGHDKVRLDGLCVSPQSHEPPDKVADGSTNAWNIKPNLKSGSAIANGREPKVVRTEFSALL